MALDWTGSVDIVINNAGILRDRSFAKMTPDMFEAVLDVHLKGTFFVTQPAWQHMRDAHYGRVVNTSSNSGLIGNFGQANYGAAKAAILGLTRVLASEWAKYGIRVNAVAPMAATRMTESLLPPELVAGLDPAAVAPVVAWLAHESCPVTGNIYSAGGGRVARLFIGLTQGYYSDDLTVEQVAEHWAQVTDTDGAVVPEAPAEEIDQLLRLRSAYLAGRAG
jgi:NAD(P)-dependent dehydrogenase (short-subunit alcohol dehydrogenase family)